MLVQILASSACTGVVCTISAPKTSNSSAALAPEPLADAADDARQRGDLLEEVVLRDALGHVRDEQVLADREAAPLLDVAGHPLGRAGRDRRAQDQRLALAQHRQQVVDHLRICEMSISMCTCAGVPSVSTMWSAARGVLDRCGCARSRPGRRAPARAAPGCRSRGTACGRRRPARAPRRSRSTPITSRPRSANESASGRPTRPRPTTATLCMAQRGYAAARRRRSRSVAGAANAAHEARVGGQVARQQPPRLLRDAVDPLEPALLHPRRAPSRRARRGSRRRRRRRTSPARRAGRACAPSTSPAWARRCRPRARPAGPR